MRIIPGIAGGIVVGLLNLIPASALAQQPAINWTGLYLGAHGGYGFGSVDWDTFAPGGPFQIRHSNDIKGGAGGVHLGWQHQVNQFVGGIEISWSGGELKSDRDAVLYATNTRTLEAGVDSLFLAALRFGLANTHWHWFGKAGYARAEVTTIMRDLTGGFGPGVIMSKSVNKQNGWTLGAGIEFAPSPNWIFGLEYNYVNLGSASKDGVQAVGVIFTNHENKDPAFSTVMARVSYKFGQ